MEKDTPQNTVTVVIGLCLALSELLPFIKQIESNGFTHFLYLLGYKTYQSFIENKNCKNEPPENEPEMEPLIEQKDVGTQTEHF